MKLIACGLCSRYYSMPADGSPESCLCGNVTARWTDAHLGTVEIIAADLQAVRVIGLHNDFLAPAFTRPGVLGGMRGVRDVDNERWRQAHAAATDCPGYLFDADKRACWAVIIAPHESGDVTWTENPGGAVRLRDGQGRLQALLE